MAFSVSVVVPCFNVGDWLIECIESVRLQSLPAFEIIIVDDGSDSAETRDILEHYKKVSGIRVLRKSNGGVSSARNAGLDAANGDYVVFLDADDYLEPGALSVMVAAANKAGAVFVGAGWRAVDECGGSMHCAAPGRSSADCYTEAVTSGMAVGGVMTKYRGDIRFNDTMPWEALEYFLDYLSLGERAILIDDIVVNRRQSDSPERLTNKLDHFEPMRMGMFFAGRKERLFSLNAASDQRLLALDRRILSCIHSLLYADRFEEAAVLARNVSSNLLDQHAHYGLGSFVWSFKWGGIRAAKSFVTINRLIGR